MPGRTTALAAGEFVSVRIDSVASPVGGGTVPSGDYPPGQPLDRPRRAAGTLFTSETELAITADALTSSKQSPAPQAGRYTGRLASDPSRLEATVSQGSGVFALVIDSGDEGKIIGKLGDGTAFTASAGLSAGGVFPLFAAAHGTGSMGGALTFDATQPASDFTGTLRWIKPARFQDSLFPGAWPGGLSLPTDGARYTPPRGAQLPLPGLPPISPDGNMTFLAGDGMTQFINLAPNGKLTIAPPPSLQKFTLKLAGATGLLKGSYIVAGQKRPVAGVLLQKAGSGEGFVLGNDESAQVRLEIR